MSNNVKHKESGSERFGAKTAVAIMAWFGYGKRKKLMLTKRLKVPKFSGWWAAVGGSVEPYEYIEEAAQREFREETGVYIVSSEFHLIDCYQEDDFKCFFFEMNLGAYYAHAMKNTEPEKHSNWQFFTPSQALRLPKLMPALKRILLTKRQVRSKMRAYYGQYHLENR